MKNTNKRSRLWPKVLLVFALILIAFAWYFFIYDPPYSGPIKMEAQTLVFAHRGGGFYAPDNSLIGAEQSMEKGYNGVDMDAQETIDGTSFSFMTCQLIVLPNRPAE